MVATSKQDELLKTLGYLPLLGKLTTTSTNGSMNAVSRSIGAGFTALGLVNHSMENYDRRLAELTTMPAYPEGMVTSRTQLKQMMQFARMHEVHLDSLDKATIEDTLTRADIPKVVREVLVSELTQVKLLFQAGACCPLLTTTAVAVTQWSGMVRQLVGKLGRVFSPTTSLLATVCREGC